MSGKNVSVLNDAPRHKDVRGSRRIAPRILNLGMVKDGSEWSLYLPGRFTFLAAFPWGKQSLYTWLSGWFFPRVDLVAMVKIKIS